MTERVVLCHGDSNTYGWMTAEDGFHLDADGHRAVGEAVARRIASMF